MQNLYSKLIELSESGQYPFHMPGHKRKIESTPLKGAFRCDITEIDDFDNLHDEEGIILKAEERANRLYGAYRTYFCVNGSTAGVLAAVSAAVKKGGTILAARGSHKSFYHAAFLRELDIKYLPDKSDDELKIPGTYTQEDVENFFDEKVEAVFITSPTYEGRCSDIEGIANACHKRGIPLIVDSAHGAHFGFGKKYDKDGEYDSVPENTISLGADIVIHSVHKTLPSMTQTSLIHISENEELADKVKKYLRIYQTSSPSYVLMSSIDLCMQEMEENGDGYIEALLDYRNRISGKTRSLKNIVIPSRETIDDPAKVVICDSSGTMTGKQIYGILREEYNLQLEMAGDKIALAILSGWDTTEGIDRLIEAVSELDEKIQKTKINTGTSVNDPICKKGLTEYPHVIMKLSEAWDRPTEETLLKEAKGKVAGDFINLYPPGIPLIVPGEEFSEELIQDICGYIEEDLNVQGVISEPRGTGFYVRTIK
ncbi:aminotransferase class I/II-fold pyridoxal phosphate-dependent enzyme [Butyrivibrio sp. M55]|uniref:aminotransferase class I/II-fold pyridoxal phosphate-dependent enzyme n=1 Tax=Butyrivibrio sp. M55 TaxID=1855323 RepID=UPI0008EE03DD|nr:aminotransferase class V-fold PLP-dependent enzyme [Butyrivibrio sp. M55]SFU85604.1 Arginine/lysine/ornithine decarboxylase [Butyrivibrio sp. M55]